MNINIKYKYFLLPTFILKRLQLKIQSILLVMKRMTIINEKKTDLAKSKATKPPCDIPPALNINMNINIKVLRVGESYYHAACFTCTECHASLSKGSNHDDVDEDDDDVDDDDDDDDDKEPLMVTI